MVIAETSVAPVPTPPEPAVKPVRRFQRATTVVAKLASGNTTPTTPVQRIKFVRSQTNNSVNLDTPKDNSPSQRERTPTPNKPTLEQ
jgi:hypothetical protein